MTPNIHLHDKVVLVTGGAQGIGQAIARACALNGADVAILDLDLEQAERTAQDIALETGRKVQAYETDVTDLVLVRAAVNAALADFGRLDVLVNNAGWDRFAFFLETTPEFWDKVIEVNYKGVLNCCYTVLPHMVKQRSGAIVNIASDAGRGGSMGESIYAGAKGAVIAFSKTLAREHARDNIRVNVVSPGITSTGLLKAMQESETGAKVIQAIARSVPLGRRPAEPEEIAPAVVFLASDAAGYITGQVLSVSGGLTMVD